MSDNFSFAPIEPEEELVEPTPRRRGRPPGSKNKTSDTVGSGGEPQQAEKPRRRRRKPKPEDISFMAERLIGLHAMLAGFTGIAEFQLSPLEAKMLAESGLQVQREFDIEIGGKWAVLASFVGVCGIIYIPRLKKAGDIVRARKRKETVIDVKTEESNG